MAYTRHFDELSRLERQPCVFGQGSLLTWDGRLDNRDDLLIVLHHDLGPDLSDAAIVAAAYARWGLDCLPRLIGDWGLSIWDASRRRLVIARDYMGNRPLYYVSLHEGLAWSSSLDALAEGFGLYTRPDESYIAAHLTFGVLPGMTPFAGAQELRAGHVLVATAAEGVRVRRYWTFSPSRSRYRDQTQYAEQLRHLLTEAVRVRLRASKRVWAHLSGGWDSSSVVCLAHALIQHRLVEAPSLQPLSLIMTDSPESDESPFVQAAERWCSLTSVKRAYIGGYPRFDQLLGNRRPTAYIPEKALEAPVRSAGDHIVLSGEGGDLVMLRGSALQPASLIEPLHDGHPLEFLRLCFVRARRKQRPVLGTITRVLLAGYAPRYAEAAAKRRLLAQRAKDAGASPRSEAELFGVTPDLLACAPRRESLCPSLFTGFSRVKRPLIQGLYALMDHGATSCSDLAPELWRTFPYTHRPLVEFAIGAPQLALWQPTFSRAGMRQALAGVLPPEILARASKGDPRTVSKRTELASVEDFIDSGIPREPVEQWQVVKRGYVQSHALTRALGKLQGGDSTPNDLLLSSVLIEAWLRTLSALPQTHVAAPDHLSQLNETVWFGDRLIQGSA
jgi:asparagine synthase (glutamine-hydrolysing)